MQATLTETSIPTLPVGVHKDNEVKGLSLHVSKTGRRTWSVFKWSPEAGKGVRSKVGLWPDLKVKQARVQAQAAAVLIGAGMKPRGGDRVQRAKVVRADAHQAAVKDAALATTAASGVVTFRVAHASYELALRAKGRRTSWCEDAFEWSYSDWWDRALDSLTADEVSRRQAREMAERGPHAAARGAKALRLIYRSAAKRSGYSGPDYSLHAELAEVVARERVMSREEEKRMEATIADEDNNLLPWARVFFKLLLATGARWGNLVACRFDELDLDRRIWTVPASKSKNRKAMKILLSPRAVELLRERRKEVEGEWAFPSVRASAEGHITDPAGQWKRLLSLSKIAYKDLTMHDLRRTFASRHADAGTPIGILSKMMGHASETVTRKYYAHVQDSAALEHLDRVEAARLAA